MASQGELPAQMAFEVPHRDNHPGNWNFAAELDRVGSCRLNPASQLRLAPPAVPSPRLLLSSTIEQESTKSSTEKLEIPRR